MLGRLGLCAGRGEGLSSVLCVCVWSAAVCAVGWFGVVLVSSWCRLGSEYTLVGWWFWLIELLLQGGHSTVSVYVRASGFVVVAGAQGWSAAAATMLAKYVVLGCVSDVPFCFISRCMACFLARHWHASMWYGAWGFFLHPFASHVLWSWVVRQLSNIACFAGHLLFTSAPQWHQLLCVVLCVVCLRLLHPNTCMHNLYVCCQHHTGSGPAPSAGGAGLPRLVQCRVECVLVGFVRVSWCAPACCV